MTPWNVSRLIEFKRRIYPEKPPWGELISTKTRAAPGSRPSAWAWPPAQMAEDDFRSVGWTLRTKRYSDADTVWNHWFSVRRANCYEQLVTQTQSKGTGVKMMTMVRRHGILSFDRFLWYTCRNFGPLFILYWQRDSNKMSLQSIKLSSATSSDYEYFLFICIIFLSGSSYWNPKTGIYMNHSSNKLLEWLIHLQSVTCYQSHCT